MSCMLWLSSSSETESMATALDCRISVKMASDRSLVLVSLRLSKRHAPLSSVGVRFQPYAAMSSLTLSAVALTVK